MARFLAVFLLFVVTSASHAAYGQDSRAAQAPFIHPKADQEFVQDAVGYGLAHEERLRLIARGAADAALRATAASLLAAQAAINADLKRLASRKDIPMPADAGDDVTLVRRELAGLSGAAFDRAARSQLRLGYDVQAGLFAQEARLGLDPELRAWARQTLASLHERQQFVNARR